jgi:hypothetical protein
MIVLVLKSSYFNVSEVIKDSGGMSRGRSADIVTGYGLDGPGFDSWYG